MARLRKGGLMKIKSVSIEFKELRSAGYPSFCNKTFGVGYQADVEDSENPDEVKRELLERAMTDVKRLHGDLPEGQSIKIQIVEQKVIPF
jgi:hypothetical protein